MGCVFFILPLAFGLLLLPYTPTRAFNVRTMPSPTQTQAQAQAQHLNPQIEKACASAPYKSLCIDNLKAMPESKTADVKTLAFMSINVTKAYAAVMSDWINNKLQDSDIGPTIEQGLTDCLDQYNDALAQLDQSMAAFFNTNGFKDVITFISSAMSDADTCQEGLKDEKVGDLMENKNNVFSQYCSNALAVVNAFQKQM